MRCNKDIMIDIETLSTKTNASIISIAMVNFDRITGEDKNHKVINIDKSEWSKNNRNISADTLLWWEKQKIGLSYFAENKDIYPCNLISALRGINEFFNECNADDNTTVWFNGASFDGAILKSAYEYFDVSMPWKYWQVNDVRTISALIPYYKKKFVNHFDGTPHDPLYDCLTQCKYLVAVLNSLKHNMISVTYKELIEIYTEDIKSNSVGVAFIEEDGTIMSYMYLNEELKPIMYYSLLHLDYMDEDPDIKIEFYDYRIMKLDEIHKMRRVDIEKHINEEKNANTDNNVKFICERIKEDGGKLVDFGDGKPSYLIGATSTDEDYYWLGLKFKDGKYHPSLEFNSCVGSYEIVKDVKTQRAIRECFDNNPYIMQEYIKNNIEKDGYDVLFALNVGEF